MTDTADDIKEPPADADVGVVRHPSGWWKSNERWKPPAHADTADRMVALSLAVAAIVLGSFLPWAHQLFTTVRGTDGAGNVTLLLGGTAGALVARWWLDGSVDRRLLTGITGLCATTAVVSLYEITVVARNVAQPQSGLFLAAAGAIAATTVAVAELRHHRVVSI